MSGDLGVHTFAGFTLKTVGSRTITVTDATRSAVSSGITVTLGAVDHFTFVGVPASVTAGSSFAGSVTVTAYDSSNNVKTDYVGSVYFTSSDAQAVLPFTSGSQYTFVSGDNGVHAFVGSGFVLKTVPSQTVTVRDDAASKSLTSSAITVNFAPLDHFTFSAISSPKVAGTGFSITITAKDAFENTVTSYTTAGTLSDLSGAISPTASGAFVSGVRTVTVTITKTYSDDTISITASTKSGTSNAFTVNPGALDHFTIGSVSSPQVAGTAFSVTITAYDINNNVKTDYAGTATLTCTAGSGSIAPGSVSSWLNGVASPSVTVIKTGTGVSITAADSGHTGVSNGFNVNPGALSKFAFSNIGAQTAGTAFSIIVTAQDANGNTVTGYSSSVPLSVSFGTISPTSTGTSGWSGSVWTGTVSLTTSGSGVTITANDGSSHTGTSNTFNVITAPTIITGSTIASSFSRTYSVTQPNSFVVIVVTGGNYRLTGVTPPAGFTQEEWLTGSDNYESAYIAVNTAQATGSYTVSCTAANSNTGISIAVYVFEPGTYSYTHANAVGSTSASLTLAAGANYYVFGGSDGNGAMSLSTSTIDVHDSSNYSSIGHQNTQTGSVSSTQQRIMIVGIGITRSG